MIEAGHDCSDGAVTLLGDDDFGLPFCGGGGGRAVIDFITVDEDYDAVALRLHAERRSHSLQ